MILIGIDQHWALIEGVLYEVCTFEKIGPVVVWKPSIICYKEIDLKVEASDNACIRRTLQEIGYAY